MSQEDPSQPDSPLSAEEAGYLFSSCQAPKGSGPPHSTFRISVALGVNQAASQPETFQSASLALLLSLRCAPGIIFQRLNPSIAISKPAGLLSK